MSCRVSCSFFLLICKYIISMQLHLYVKYTINVRFSLCMWVSVCLFFVSSNTYVCECNLRFVCWNRRIAAVNIFGKFPYNNKATNKTHCVIYYKHTKLRRKLQINRDTQTCAHIDRRKERKCASCGKKTVGGLLCVASKWCGGGEEMDCHFSLLALSRCCCLLLCFLSCLFLLFFWLSSTWWKRV